MWEKELKAAIEAAELAKKKIMEIYQSGFDVEIKDDNSPVTNADKTADKIIREYLQERFPTYAFLTEESDDNLDRLNNDLVWIIDPVDGTKDFVAKDDEFTTNIALAYKHELVVGVVMAPALNVIYFASKGNGSFVQYLGKNPAKLKVNNKISDLTVLTSVFHSNEKEMALIEKHKDKIKHVEKIGSSLKPCRIAEGMAEITYRMSPNTKEWDTAACQIIVEEAGGLFLKPDGTPIKYNRKDVYNRDGYLVINRMENFLL
ncbi:MAG: 3'(2'),5'-bisphosphate nucleotidase CysQ [Bacilli bacterium]|nr:3'(2'),5'-bisphosphate nucleotidase CysQ [Bacilli bacterium]